MNSTSPLLEKLTQIESVLSSIASQDQRDDIGVLSGRSGVALFQFYYAKLLQNESNAEIGAAIIAEIVDSINEGYNFPTFCSGIAGAAWAIELLKEEDLIDINTDDLLSGLDEYLHQAMRHMGTEDNFYDFLHGVMGIGFYFLKRYQNTERETLRSRYKKIILEVISILNTTAIKEDNTAKWEVFLIKQKEVKGCNLSLSHGIASIINFLSRIAEHEEFYKDVDTLIQQAISYVLSCEKAQPSSSRYPSWIYEGMAKDENARLGWCYGDLGIGITLWRAGKVLNNHKLVEKGLAILNKTKK